MEKENLDILELLPAPSFCVRDGMIVKINQAARKLSVPENAPVLPLLCTGQEAYMAFSGGCLNLTVRLGNGIWEATVNRVGGVDVFQVRSEPDTPELRVLAQAAKQIRGSVSSVMLGFQVMTGNGPEDRKKEASATVARGLCQLTRIIGNMSDASAGVPVLRMEYQDVAALYRELMEKVAGLVDESEIRLHYAGPDHPVYTVADSQLLERSLYNMLSNAMKFASEGSEIRVSLTRKDQVLCLQVTDDGPGIPEAVMPKLFCRYQRPLTLEDGKNGLGLGMVLIRSAANAHGGTVLVDHPGGTGTRVTMTIAIRQGSDAMLRSDVLRVDYAGELDHTWIELSEVLPTSVYEEQGD